MKEANERPCIPAEACRTGELVEQKTKAIDQPKRFFGKKKGCLLFSKKINKKKEQQKRKHDVHYCGFVLLVERAKTNTKHDSSSGSNTILLEQV